ncbi:MAG: lysophospholipid acyltransferase family protein [Anaerolineae bacterium]|jgi:1-acyl-sn-glycerol-3-phosphate acyltransferase
MTDLQAPATCQALTRSGRPCKNPPQAGSSYCHVHRDSPAQQLSDDELRRQIMAQLDGLIRQIEALEPDYQPPPFSPEGLIDLLRDRLPGLSLSTRLDLTGHLRRAAEQGWFQAETWKGVWYLVNYTLQYNAGLLKQRWAGEYETDEWGLDREFLDMLRPLLTLIYKAYWRVETSGLDHLSPSGGALLVANHSGQVPWDAVVLATAVLDEHPAQRLVRALHGSWAARVPFLSALLARMGHTVSSVENGVRLLEQGDVVAVFPEGEAGLGKTFQNRYQLAPFEPTFVQMALRAGTPIVPVSVVGAEETAITLARSKTLGRVVGLPYVPITTTFPWLGLLGLVPLPTKWYIDFGQPIPAEGYGPGADTNLVLAAQLADRVRHAVRSQLDDRLVQRRSLFFG